MGGGTDYYTYHRDVLYWIGNLNSLMKQYPSIDPREYTNGIFNYHYFSSLQLAVQSLFCGVDTVVTCIGLYFHATIVMIVFGTYLFAKNVIKDGKAVILAMCALLITSGAENVTKIEQVCHYALTAFGTDYGLGVLLFVMIALLRYCEKPLKINGIICIVLLAILTGTKGPYAAIVICGFGGICFIWLIQKKIARALLFGGSSLTVFGLTYYFVCNTKGYIGGQSQKLLNLVIRTDPSMSMIEACLRKLCREIVNILLMKPVVLLPFLFILVMIVYRRKHMSAFGFSCLCMVMAGLAVNAIITMPTNQQTYFALAAMVPAWCFVLTEGNHVNWLSCKQKKIYKFGSIFMAAVFVFGVFGFVAGYTYNGNRFNVIYSFDDGIRMISSRITGKTLQFDDEYIDNGFILQQDEYEILQDIKDDGDSQAIILHVLPEDRERRRSYRGKLIGSFSKKYIMSEEAIGGLSECNEEEYQKLYNMGVRYVLIDYWNEEKRNLSDDYTEEIYAGERMKLYRLRVHL